MKIYSARTSYTDPLDKYIGKDVWVRVTIKHKTAFDTWYMDDLVRITLKADIPFELSDGTIFDDDVYEIDVYERKSGKPGFYSTTVDVNNIKIKEPLQVYTTEEVMSGELRYFI